MANMAAENYIDLLMEANLGYDVAVERNLNVPTMRRRLENVLWTYRSELASLGKQLAEAKKEIADLNEMLDAVSGLSAKSAREDSTEPSDEKTATKKKAR